MIINHDNKEYRRRWNLAGDDRYNGAYYYSREICKNIIPNVKTDRHWVTINTEGMCYDHAIVFIHNNLYPEIYDWLKDFDDLVLVCGVPDTVKKVEPLGKAIYLPLSIDVKFVKSFSVRPEEHMKPAAFAGRAEKAKRHYASLPEKIDYLAGIPRPELLQEMAWYKTIYAVGRTAIEAKALGCTVKAYDERYPDPDMWEVLDNLEAAKILQKKLDEIDGTKIPQEKLDEIDGKKKRSNKSKKKDI